MERPSGPPLGAATQSTGRPMAENGIPRLAPLNTARKIPNSTIQHAASSSSLSVHIPTSAGQVVALAREAMKVALEENQTKAAEASGVSNELKPGVTIDLSHKQIQRFPEEVVDIIKNELERYVFSILFYLESSTSTPLTPLFLRLALSHNQISTFPSRFSECTSLRYLNIRNNVIREFPQSVRNLI
jgi:hypothetical protein